MNLLLFSLIPEEISIQYIRTAKYKKIIFDSGLNRKDSMSMKKETEFIRKKSFSPNWSPTSSPHLMNLMKVRKTMTNSSLEIDCKNEKKNKNGVSLVLSTLKKLPEIEAEDAKSSESKKISSLENVEIPSPPPKSRRHESPRPLALKPSRLNSFSSAAGKK